MLRTIMAIGLVIAGGIAPRAAEPSGKPLPLFQNLKTGKRQTVVVYGTSLTAGGEWVKLLSNWFNERYPKLVTVINSGGSGQNSDWGVANLKTKVLAHQPDLVLVEFSFNDAHEKFKLTPEKAAANLTKIVDGIVTQNANTTIALQIMNPAWDANDRMAATNRPQLIAFNDNYRQCAHTRKLPLLDHYTAWEAFRAKEPEQFRELIPDGAHPTAAGCQQVLWPTIQAWLEQAQAGK